MVSAPRRYAILHGDRPVSNMLGGDKYRLLCLLRMTQVLIFKGWSPNGQAVDQFGGPVSRKDPAACKWSIAGAIGVSIDCLYGETGAVNKVRTLNALRSHIASANDLKYGMIGVWENAPERTRQDILDALNRAYLRVLHDLE